MDVLTCDILTTSITPYVFPVNSNVLTCDILTTSITPHVSLNPQAEIFIPINSYAVEFSPEQKSSAKELTLKLSTNESVKEFSVTPTSQNNSLNYDAVIFVPRHCKMLNGFHVISVILIIFIILIILLLEMIDVSGRKCMGDFSPKVILKRLKISNPQNLILSHLNINALRYKFECLKSIIDSNIDLLLISETKLNYSFPNSQFDWFPPSVLKRQNR